METWFHWFSIPGCLYEIFERKRLVKFQNEGNDCLICIISVMVRLEITSKFLYGKFTDYEPGIHYPQIQMQSGTTGINTIRIYNVIKQSYDQDPDGIFYKKMGARVKETPQTSYP